MNVNDLIEDMTHQHGIRFMYDLPEEGRIAGQYWPTHQTIHLTRNPHIYTVLHEMGHHLQYKTLNPIFNIFRNIGWALSLFGIIFALIGVTSYSMIFICANIGVVLILVYLTIDLRMNGEKRADEYGRKELRKLTKKGYEW